MILTFNLVEGQRFHVDRGRSRVVQWGHVDNVVQVTLLGQPVAFAVFLIKLNIKRPEVSSSFLIGLETSSSFS
jgi:hypothetical protein